MHIQFFKSPGELWSWLPSTHLLISLSATFKFFQWQKFARRNPNICYIIPVRNLCSHIKTTLNFAKNIRRDKIDFWGFSMGDCYNSELTRWVNFFFPARWTFLIGEGIVSFFFFINLLYFSNAADWINSSYFYFKDLLLLKINRVIEWLFFKTKKFQIRTRFKLFSLRIHWHEMFQRTMQTTTVTASVETKCSRFREKLRNIFWLD